MKCLMLGPVVSVMGWGALFLAGGNKSSGTPHARHVFLG